MLINILSYSGILNSAGITEIIEKTDSEILKFSGLCKIDRNRIRTITIEALQNIHHYIGKNPSFGIQEKEAEFCVRLSREYCQMICCNYVVKTDGMKLINCIESVNSLSVGSLKDRYRLVLAGHEKLNDTDPGLGLLKMAILSGNKLKYDILSPTENLVRFRIIVNLRLTTGRSEGSDHKRIESQYLSAKRAIRQQSRVGESFIRQFKAG